MRENAPENANSRQQTSDGAGSGTATFVLRPIPWMANEPDSLTITTAEHDELRGAREILLAAISIEQKFSVMVDNYIEYERELLDLAIQKSVRFDFHWRTMHEDLLTVNRRLANLLSTARMYLDHLRGDVGKIAAGSAGVILSATISAQYDERLGFRVIEALRNTMQHQTLGVSQIGYPHEAINAERRIRAVPRLSVMKLSETDFKARVLDELRGRSVEDTHDVTPFVREYLEGLGMIHKDAREQTTSIVESANSTMLAWLQRLEELWPRRIGYLISPVDERAGESVQVFGEIPKYLKWLIRNNQTLVGQKIVFVSGQVN